MSLFEVMYGYYLRMLADIVEWEPKYKGVFERLKNIRKIRQGLKKSWSRAVKKQAKYYNARHTPKEFYVENVVDLLT